MEKFCVLDYYSNVEYQGLCATINLSKIKDLEKQEESHTIGLLSIQIDKYENGDKFKLFKEQLYSVIKGWKLFPLAKRTLKNNMTEQIYGLPF